MVIRSWVMMMRRSEVGGLVGRSLVSGRKLEEKRYFKVVGSEVVEGLLVSCSLAPWRTLAFFLGSWWGDLVVKRWDVRFGS